VQSYLTYSNDSGDEDPFSLPDVFFSTPHVSQVITKRPVHPHRVLADLLTLQAVIPHCFRRREMIKAQFHDLGDGPGTGIVVWVPRNPPLNTTDLYRNHPGFSTVDKVLFAKAFENKYPPCTGPQYDPYYFELIVTCDVTEEPHVTVHFKAPGLPDVVTVQLNVKKDDNMVHLSVKMDDNMEDDNDFVIEL
jgi:hypothetical protein